MLAGDEWMSHCVGVSMIIHRGLKPQAICREDGDAARTVNARSSPLKIEIRGGVICNSQDAVTNWRCVWLGQQSRGIAENGDYFHTTSVSTKTQFCDGILIQIAVFIEVKRCRGSKSSLKSRKGDREVGGGPLMSGIWIDGPLDEAMSMYTETRERPGRNLTSMNGTCILRYCWWRRTVR